MRSVRASVRSVPELQLCAEEHVGQQALAVAVIGIAALK